METDHSNKPVAIEVWQELQRQLAKETSLYLSLDKFVLQRDAYTRLAEDDIAGDVPWLSYDYEEMTSDSSLDFHLFFERDIFSLVIGPHLYEIPYRAFGHSSTEALSAPDLLPIKVSQIVKNIIITIKLLLNGQIAIGANFRRGQLLAAETFLAGFAPVPWPIGIDGRFSWLRSAATDYMLKQNRVLAEQIKVSPDFPLLPPVVNGERVRRGRAVEALDELEPLNKNQYQALKTNADLHEFAGKEAQQNADAYFYSTIEFWTVATLVVGVLAFMKFGPTAKIFHAGWLQPAYVIVGWLAIYLGTGFLLGRRQVLINQGEEPLTYRIEQKIRKYGFKGFLLPLSLGLLPLVFVTPLWTLKSQSTGLHPGFSLLGQVPQLYVLLLLNIVLIGLLTFPRLFGYKLVRWLFVATAVAFFAGIFVINGLYMNSSDSAPEANFVLELALLLVPFVLIVFGLLAALPRRSGRE